MQVQELMTPDVCCCSPEQSLSDAARIMWERDCGSVPIVDQERHLVGIITDRDICMAAYTQGKSLNDLHIADFMIKKVIATEGQDTVAHASELMRTHQIRRLPIIDRERKVIGIVALNDIAIATRPSGQSRRNRISADELAATMAEVSRHRDGQQSGVQI